MIRVSVIIPAYDSEKFISETIMSVLNQTYKDYELIIVDDGSTDNTAAIVKRYVSLHNNIRYIYQPHHGQSEAKNIGIRESKGEFIAFLDHDDIWLPNKLEKQIKALSPSNYKIICCDMQLYENGELISGSALERLGFKYIRSGFVYNEILWNCFLFSSTVLLNRDCFRTVGVFNGYYKMAEDYDLWLRMAKIYPISFMNERLVMRRLHAHNLSKNMFFSWSSLILLFTSLLAEESLGRKEKLIIKKRLSEFYFDIGYYYWDKENLFLARINYLKALSYKNDIALRYRILFTYLPRNLIRGIRKIIKCFIQKIKGKPW